MMDEVNETEVQHKVNKYLNPITLESFQLHNTIQQFQNDFGMLDENLSVVLINLMASIESFVKNKSWYVFETENTKLIDLGELADISRIYHCEKCNKDLGKDLSKVVVHLIEGHKDDSIVGLHKNERKEKRNAERINALQKKERREKLKAERNNKLEKLPKKAKSLINTNHNAFFNESIQVGEKLKLDPAYDVIENDLMALVEPLFPDQTIKLYKFGSRLTGTGTRNSDLDIFIDIGDSFNIFENQASDVTLEKLYKVNDVMKKNPKQWVNLVTVDNARVPILKVRNVKTYIDVDIGFSNSLGYCNTQLIEYLFDLQPIARRMVLFLKKWLVRCKLDKNITTYSVTLMVIHYLQMKKLLPPIAHLQSDMPSKMLVGPWTANFLHLPASELKMEPVSVDTNACKIMLQSFFTFFANFDYAKYVICPYLGEDIPIGSYLAHMPDSYKDFVGDKESDIGLQIKKPIVVQDPIQLNHNVTKCISKSLLQRFVKYFQESKVVFDEIMN